MEQKILKLCIWVRVMYLCIWVRVMYSGWGMGVGGGAEEEDAKQEKDYNIKSTVLPRQFNGYDSTFHFREHGFHPWSGN